jgi:glycosyltransferase involved in cell wall biosynthesis
VIDGVEFIPVDDVGQLSADVVILNTSGDQLDLTAAIDLQIRTASMIIWTQGVQMPQGLHELNPDYVYVPSRFIGDIAFEEWGVEARKIVVANNFYDEKVATAVDSELISRDPKRMVYSAHPSKGLGAAVCILERLRETDPEFVLDIFGGDALWGQSDRDLELPEGATFHGKIGQARLACEMRKATFSIQLQTRREPGALLIPEAFEAGCIIIASPVGCYPEQIQNGVNGFLIEGDPVEASVQDTAAEVIQSSSADAQKLDAIRAAGRQSAIGSLMAARSWISVWKANHNFPASGSLSGILPYERF